MEENIILIYGLKKCINNIRINFEPSLNIFFSLAKKLGKRRFWDRFVQKKNKEKKVWCRRKWKEYLYI